MVLLVWLVACADEEPKSKPLASEPCPVLEEVPYDGLDQDCDGSDLIDVDQDGEPAEEAGGADCDDLDPDRGPGRSEVPYDGVDQDCDGADLDDVDQDGAVAAEVGGPDCEDADPSIGPEGVEVPYDGVDQDCLDGDLVDVDGDGFVGQPAGGDDCDDEDPMRYPGAPDLWYDGIDHNCDRVDDFDRDGDGDSPPEFGGGDCNDEDAAWNDLDDDGDGVGRCSGDCDDADPARTPGREDLCGDGFDSDCDGQADQGCPGLLEEGWTYDVAWSGMDVIEPAAFFLISSFFGSLFVQVTDLEGTSFTASLASDSIYVGPDIVDCGTFVQVPGGDFTANPHLSVGPTDVYFEVFGDPVVMERFILDAEVAWDGSALYDLDVSARIDLRPLNAELGLDLCDLVGLFGDACSACSDGGIGCLRLEAEGSLAERVEGVDPLGTCGG